jgi:hypothetical protein
VDVLGERYHLDPEFFAHHLVRDVHEIQQRRTSELKKPYLSIRWSRPVLMSEYQMNTENNVTEAAHKTLAIHRGFRVVGAARPAEIRGLEYPVAWEEEVTVHFPRGLLRNPPTGGIWMSNICYCDMANSAVALVLTDRAYGRFTATGVALCQT